MSEYGDPISPEQIELAVERALDLHRAAPELPLDDHVREAVARDDLRVRARDRG